MYHEASFDVCLNLFEEVLATINTTKHVTLPDQHFHYPGTDVLMCIPYHVLRIVVAFYLCTYLLLLRCRSTDNRAPYPKTKMYISIVLTTVTLIQQSRQSSGYSLLNHVQNLYNMDWIKYCTLLLLALGMKLEKCTGFAASMSLFLLRLLMLVMTCLPMYDNVLQKVYTGDFFKFALDGVSLSGVLVLICWPVRLKTGKHSAVSHSENLQHPEDTASFTSALFYDWVFSLVKKGYTRKLEENDVPDLNRKDLCQTTYPPLARAWQHEVLRQRKFQSFKANTTESSENLFEETPQENKNKAKVNIKTPSLTRALLKAYGMRFFLYQVVQSVIDLSDFLIPLLVEALMKHIQNRGKESAWWGVTLVITMFIVTISKEVCSHRNWSSIERLCNHGKAALKLILFEKALGASNMSKKEKTSGQIVSLMGEYIDEVSYWSQRVFLFFLFPIQVSLALYILYCQLGMAAFAGLAILLSLIPLNYWVGKKMHFFDEERDNVKDRRIKVMNEILNGIKVLKLYAWEKSFMKKVMNIRDEEVKISKKISLCVAFVDIMFRAIPFLVQVVVFLIFLALGGFMDPAKAFVVGSLFEILNEPFSEMAIVVPGFAKARVSLRKLNNFMNYQDISHDVVLTKPEAETAVSIKKGTFTWDTSNKNPTLKNINLEIAKGKLVAVVGMVGAGKSSLLLSMLGEMEKLEGKVTVQSSIGYVAQEAWIQNATLRDNILFGSEFVSKKYSDVINACALKDDINILAAGDQTEIGEKGINLSGGQKQRVSLARAVYSDADIYLLDDPLSAVDTHVGKHIFNEVIGHKGLLRDKTRILVTHGIHWMPFVDHIIVMKDGQISEIGTCKELIDHNGNFAQFLNDVFNKQGNEVDSEVQDIRKSIFTRLSSLNEAKPSDVSDSSDKDIASNLDQHQPGNTSSDVTGAMNDHLCDSENEMSSESEMGYESEEDYEAKGKLIDEEDTEFGSISWNVYKEYGKAVGPKYILLFSIIFSLLLVSRDYKYVWLGEWTEDPLIANASLVDTEEYQSLSWFYLTVYALLGTIEAILAFFFIIILQMRAHEAAKKLHNKLLANVMRLPMSFFDTTPTGRIITRFSKDTACVDDLGECLERYIRLWGNLMIHLLMIIYITPQLLAFLFFATIVFTYLQRLYIASARQLRRYRSKHTAPIFVHFKETLDGVATIRAFKVQERFVTKMEKVVENHMKFDLMELFVGKWFAIKLMLLSSSIAMAAGLLVIWNHDISPSMAGLVITYSAGFVDYLCWMIFHSSHTEQELVSLERVIEYTGKPTEAPWEIAVPALPAEWPQQGQIVMNDYKMRYREGLDLVLKGLTCSIQSGEKIGIVGRTGAGKSSLTVALFRLIEAAAGQICVDDRKIASLGLHDLRKKITILPQDPVIFGDSLRMNLDPLNEKSTTELWEALKHSHLENFVEGLPGKLEFDCGEGGKSLSIGQRQLVCLARTLLRKTKILVLDEATAAVDMETDDLIQKTLCKEFRHCTVLTIAHRLNTVIDYDRILVLDQGLVKEFDSPKKLLANTDSAFYKMAKDAKLV